MKATLIFTALLGLLSVPGHARQDDSTTKGPCDVRVYLLDQGHKAAPINGISAILVSEDASGRERLIPMSIVTTRSDRREAPHCVLRARPVEGTAYTAAFCALSSDGRVRELPYGDEGGGPKVNDQNPAKEAPQAQRVSVEFDVPYFKAEIPSDHSCGRDCRTSIRFTIGGTSHSTGCFPCAAGWKQGAPTCCTAHQLSAEISELTRHASKHDREQVSATLDRISACLDRQDGSARTEQHRLDCVEALSDARATLTSDLDDEVQAAIDRLKEKCAACYEGCTKEVR